MEEQNLYQNVKKKICRMIYEDIYQDGDLIPPERKLSEELGVSRVTVRKALKLLEEEHIIERIQGSGTRIALQYGAREGNMDIITLVAPAQNAFFSRFIDAFQTTAEEKDSLVLFKQKPGNMSLEKCLYQIYEKDLRNVVLWLEDMELTSEALRKLRGLGMNIVLFDTTFKSAYADAVCVDNSDAVKRLYQVLTDKGCSKIGFVGWDEKRVRSVRIREQEFCRLAPEAPVCRMSWDYRNRLDEMSMEEVEEKVQGLSGCDGIIYSVAELGIPFERKAKEKGIVHRSAMIDVLPGAEQLGITAMEQDFQGMSEKIFDCLKRQNQGGSAWKAGVYQVKGKL
ncbi:MAG: GntR family transcriptional regulator [Eubacteriales bacterium]|nr:GntR family transcriptional regulator [Eubacteriales bacterium]